VVNRHLKIFFVGGANAVDLIRKLNSAMESAFLTRRHLIVLGMDGPNVNKEVYTMSYWKKGNKYY